MLQITSSKVAGWRDWFSVPGDARANMEQAARQNALQRAIQSLNGQEHDPQIQQIIQQIRFLMQQ